MRSHVKILRADHKVNVYNGIVDAFLTTFFESVFVVIFDAILETATECEVATSVLVEQGVEEGYFGIANGRIVRNESTFTEICGVFVHRNHLFEKFLTFFGVYFDCLAVFKAHGKILDEFAAIR